MKAEAVRTAVSGHVRSVVAECVREAAGETVVSVVRWLESTPMGVGSRGWRLTEGRMKISARRNLQTYPLAKPLLPLALSVALQVQLPNTDPRTPIGAFNGGKRSMLASEAVQCSVDAL